MVTLRNERRLHTAVFRTKQIKSIIRVNEFGQGCCAFYQLNPYNSGAGRNNCFQMVNANRGDHAVIGFGISIKFLGVTKTLAGIKHTANAKAAGGS